MKRTLIALVLALALFAAPALAISTTPITLLALAAQTGSANGATIDVSGTRELVVYFHRTTASGTISTFSVYMESSDDGGSTFYEIQADSVTLGTGTAPDVTATSLKRNLITETTLTSTDTRVVGTYSNFGSKVRIRWILTGTTPSETFSVKAIAKN